MKSPEDLTGQKFGKLTPIYMLPRDKGQHSKWHCSCECGGEKDVFAAYLKSGHVKSCGCLTTGTKLKHDLVGQRFGSLVVQSRIGTRNDAPLWLCQCDCGRTAEVRTQCLLKGQTTCGFHRAKDLTGKKFGKLTVLYRTKDHVRESGRPIVMWHCKCECGNEIDTSSNELLEKGKTHCGCTPKIIYKDITGQKFGKLTALYISGDYKDTKAKVWYCKCDCGSHINVKASYLLNGNTTSCGCNNSKGEMKIKLLLEANGIEYKSEKTFRNLKFNDTGRLARFDLYLPTNKYIIEYDGIQHYQALGWHEEEDLKRTQEHDVIKTQYCKDNNIPLIRIPYTHYDNLCVEDLLLETTTFRVV